MKDPESRRIFIGIPVDAVCQQQIDSSLIDYEVNNKDIVWLPAQNRHLTLAFIGDTPPHTLRCLLKNFENAYENTRPFSFPLNQLQRFPDQKGRLLAAVNRSSLALDRLYAETQALLEQCALPLTNQSFLPHISLGKIRHYKNCDDNLQKTVSLDLMVERVNLYESLQGEEGRFYRVLNECVLKD